MINNFIVNKLTKNPLLIKGVFFTLGYEKISINHNFIINWL